MEYRCIAYYLFRRNAHVASDHGIVFQSKCAPRAAASLAIATECVLAHMFMSQDD